MRPATGHHSELLAAIDLGVVYVDLDGTLLGPGGSLFASVGGGVVLDAARALADLSTAGVEVVVASGRTRPQVHEVARLIGASAYVAELGGSVVFLEGRQERVIRNPGRAGTSATTPYEAIVRSGAGGFLLDRFSGRLEPHAPWAFLERECSMLLRGHVDLAEARAALADAGYGWLDLADNGILPDAADRFPSLSLDEVHAYHLVPAGVSKRSAVALHRADRGVAPSRCIAVGDSASDAEIGDEVGAVFIVANGAGGVAREPVAGNVYLLDRGHGAGFAEAVDIFLGGGE